MALSWSYLEKQQIFRSLHYRKNKEVLSLCQWYLSYWRTFQRYSDATPGVFHSWHMASKFSMSQIAMKGDNSELHITLCFGKFLGSDGMNLSQHCRASWIVQHGSSFWRKKLPISIDELQIQRQMTLPVPCFLRLNNCYPCFTYV